MPPRETVFMTMGSQDKADVKVTGTEFFKLMKFYSNKTLIILAAIFAIGAGVVQVIISQVMGSLTNSLSTTANFMDTMVSIIKELAIVYSCLIVLWTVSMGLRTTSNPAFSVDLRRILYSNMVEQEIDFFDKEQTGVLVSRLSEDVTLVRETYVDKSLQAIQNLSMSVAGIILAFITSWLVSLMALACVIIIILVFIFGEKAINHLYLDFSKSSTNCTAQAEEVISQFRTVKSFDAELKEADNYCRGLDGVDKIFRKTSIYHGFKNGAVNIISNAMEAAVLWLVSYLVVEKPQYGLKSGSATTLMMVLMFTVMGVSNSISFMDDFRRANVSAAKLLSIIDRKPAVNRKSGETLKGINGSIEFKDVCFKYSTRDDYAISHLSFKIEAGETVAFVGESGCGKTTTLQLLQRFYEVESGQILIDGVDIKNYSQTSLRSQIGVVPQSPVLFSMSIKDNIAYSKNDVSDEEVANAAKVGNAHNFIMELKDNYKTRVAQTSLSGGQKQRICISRSILANAPILMLDEATAALDTESEQLVQKSLETFRHGKTAIVVAHRLSTVKNADRIFVFQAGKVVEVGTHDSLMSKNGIYAELVNFQLK